MNKKFLIFLICFVIIILVFGSINIIKKNNTDSITESKISEIELKFNELKQNEIDIISSNLISIISDGEIKKLYLEKNREVLFNFLEKKFEVLNKEGITHWYYILPNNIVFLRMHNKELSGDIVKRQTFIDSRDSGKFSSGIELGKTAYALRVVSPYYFNGELIGYVELAEDVEHFLEYLENETNNDFYLIAQKKYLDKFSWKSLKENKGERDNWDDLLNYVVLSEFDENYFTDNCFNDENMFLLGAGEHVLNSFEFNGESYVCGGFLIQDASGLDSGILLTYIKTN